MNRGPKLTEPQRVELLALYLSGGFAATKHIAESYGVHPRYLAQLARKHGHKNNYPKTRPTYRRSSKDTRWQWAVERGAVIA